MKCLFAIWLGALFLALSVPAQGQWDAPLNSYHPPPIHLHSSSTYRRPAGAGPNAGPSPRHEAMGQEEYQDGMSDLRDAAGCLTCFESAIAEFRAALTWLPGNPAIQAALDTANAGYREEMAREKQERFASLSERARTDLSAVEPLSYDQFGTGAAEDWWGQARAVDLANVEDKLEHSMLPNRLASLEAELAGLQAALRRLIQSNGLNEAERAHWESVTDEAEKDAIRRGEAMAADLVFGQAAKILANLNYGIAATSMQIAFKKTLLADAKGARLQALRTTIARLERSESRMNRAVSILHTAEKGHHAEEIAGIGWESAKATQAMQAGQWDEAAGHALDAVAEALHNPEVSQALQVSYTAAGYKQAESITDSAYDITAEFVSIRRLSQLNQNSDQMLVAVSHLQASVHRTVKEINLIRSQLGRNGR